MRRCSYPYKRIVIVQSGKEKAQGCPNFGLPVPEESQKKDKKGRFTRPHSDRTRCNAF